MQIIIGEESLFLFALRKWRGSQEFRGTGDAGRWKERTIAILTVYKRVFRYLNLPTTQQKNPLSPTS